MKILTKLLLGFVIVALLCMLVGVAGVVVASRLSGSVEQLSKETIPTIGLLYQINEQMVAIKVAIRSISNPLGADDQAFITRQKENITGSRSKYADLIARFDKLPKTPEEKLLWDDVKSDIPTVKAYNDELVALADKAVSLADQGERQAVYNEIYVMIAGDRRLVFDDFLAKVQKVINYDDQYYGGELPKQAEAFGQAGKVGLIVVSLSAVIAAALLGIFMGLSISRKIRATVGAVDRMASGDLSERLEVKSKDEFLQLAKSTNACMDNIQALIAEAAMLTTAAVEGRLMVRSDGSKLSGAYRSMVDGMNEVVDALVGFIDSMPMPAMTIDKDFQVLFVNRAGAGLGRAAGKDLVEARRRCYDFFKTGDCKTERCACGQAMRLKAPASSETRATPAEQTYDVAYTGTPIVDRAGNVVGAFEVMTDQTLIKAAERKMLKIADFQNAEITKLNSYLDGLAQGDLTASYEVDAGDEDVADTKRKMDSLAVALNASVTSINEILTQVTGAVEQVSAGALQVSQASQALSQGATEQAASLEEITSSITEVSGQTRQNTENAQTVFGLSKTARENAEQGNVQMRDLVAAMSDINKSAEEIRKIVKAIDDISFQINLLALNANVEAARAGKYGKGFAVVAEEVRNLAVRSANSVKETTRMVDEAIANIERGNGLVGVTAKQLESIVEGAGKVASLAEDVSGASREQALGLDQISTGLNQIDQVTQSNTASAEESAAAAEELSSQSQQLKATLRRFRLKEVAGKVSNAEVLQLLRAELARQSGHAGGRAAAEALAGVVGVVGVAEGAGATGPAGVAHPAAGRRQGRAGGVNPSDLISLDDDNFGKF